MILQIRDALRLPNDSDERKAARVRKAFEDAENYTTQQNIEDAEALHDLLQGVAKDLVRDRIRSMYAGRKADPDDQFYMLLVNVVRKFIDQVSALHAQPPMRHWYVGDKRIDQDSDPKLWGKIERLLEVTRWNQVFRKAERLVNLHAGAFLYCTINESRGIPQIKVLPRQDLWVVPDLDDPEDLDSAEAIIMRNRTHDGINWYACWYPDEVLWAGESKSLITSPPDRPDEELPEDNPYAAVRPGQRSEPWYPFHAIALTHPYGYVLPPIPEALLESSLTVLAMLSELLRQIRFQGIGQWVFRGVSQKELPHAIGPDVLLPLPQPEQTVECVTPPAIFRDGAETLLNLFQLYAVMDDFSPELIVGFRERTGDAVMAKRLDTEMTRRERQLVWEGQENAVLQKLLRVVERWAGKLGPEWRFPRGLRVETYYRVPDWPVVNPQARSIADSTDIKADVKSPAVAIAERLGVPQSVAEEIAEEIRRENAERTGNRNENRGAGAGVDVPDVPDRAGGANGISDDGADNPFRVR